MKKKYNHSFMIARFQPLHNGHKTIIDKMLKESNYITIILGSAQESHTKENPLTVEQRKNLIINIYGEKNNMKIFYMNDINCDANAWYLYVKKFLNENVKEFGFPEAYYCGDMNNGYYYDKGEFKIEIVDRELQEGYNKISATEVRNMIKNKDDIWKYYIPKENHELIEKYFNDLEIINKNKDKDK